MKYFFWISQFFVWFIILKEMSIKIDCRPLNMTQNVFSFVSLTVQCCVATVMCWSVVNVLEFHACPLARSYDFWTHAFVVCNLLSECIDMDSCIILTIKKIFWVRELISQLIDFFSTFVNIFYSFLETMFLLLKQPIRLTFGYKFADFKLISSINFNKL